LNYDNRIELSGAEVNVSEIMEHIVAIIDNFVSVDDEDYNDSLEQDEQRYEDSKK